MTDNLPDPERPETWPTRRGRRAAESRLAAPVETTAVGGTNTPVQPAVTPVDAGAGEAAGEARVPGGRRRRRVAVDVDSPVPGARTESDDAPAAGPERAQDDSVYPPQTPAARPGEADAAVDISALGDPARDDAARNEPADDGAPGLTESDTTILTEHAAAAEDSTSATASPAGDATPVPETGAETPEESVTGDLRPDEAPERQQVAALRMPAWDGPEPATAGFSRIPLLSGLPASPFPAQTPEPPSGAQVSEPSGAPASEPFPDQAPEPPAGAPVNSDQALAAGSDAFPNPHGWDDMSDVAGEPADRAGTVPVAAGEARVPSEDVLSSTESRPAPGALPPLPAQMPADLRERTRLAVRGEPQDVRRATFLETGTAKIPATRGFRGFLAALGLRVAPSSKELSERRDTRMVSQHWPGPRTISVVNGKGGANKTPTTVMLAALFARNGGGPVLAWDNNETRGTLGWRTEQAQHDSTVMDLLPETGLLLSPVAQSAMLAKFVHHQTDDKYDVLRSNPNVLASEQKVTKADFDALHTVASKYFRLNIVDSGNDESAERWLRMIDHTDQLVIATTTVEEHAEAGALLLEALQERGGRYAELARGAVVVVSQADRNGTEAQARKVAEAFKVLARAAVTIPYDPALVKGQIRYGSLRPATQRAWLKAAAAVAEGL